MEIPTKNVIILVVTVTGWLIDPKFIFCLMMMMMMVMMMMMMMMMKMMQMMMRRREEHIDMITDKDQNDDDSDDDAADGGDKKEEDDDNDGINHNSKTHRLLQSFPGLPKHWQSISTQVRCKDTSVKHCDFQP